MLFDVNTGEHIVLNESLRKDDGVFVVVAFPGHEGNQQVLAEGEFTLIGGRSVRQYLTHLDALALGHDRALVDRSSLV